MSESEKFEVQGRAHGALKDCEGRITTAKLALRAYSRELTEMASAISAFTENPEHRNPHVPKTQSQNLKEHLARLQARTESAQALVIELADDSEAARVLREQIATF